MIGKIRQWVPIEGTRWRNEVVNEQEHRAVGSHYGVAPGGDMAPLRKLPNSAHFVVCAGAVMVIRALLFIRHRIETHYAVNERVTLGCKRGDPEHH
jgi:hypothetical protein